MLEPYAVVEVKPEWCMGPEELGTKNKFWYRAPGGTGKRWLFKLAREGTGEHWAEKVAAEAAAALGVEHAKVELALYGDARGSTTESFLGAGESLYLGNQILEATVGSYNPDKAYGQSGHTLDNVFRAMDKVFPAERAATEARCRIARYAVLDALIGNTDRHHENWGVVRSGGCPVFVAPSFDHASSLGRELADARRSRLLAEERVANYIDRGHGGIYRSENERRGPSPLNLVRWAAGKYPDLFRPALERLKRLDENVIENIVARVPDSWMSRPAREFAAASMRHGLERMRELNR